MSVERHDGDEPAICIGQWCCGCAEHPIGKPWGWNHEAWQAHYEMLHPSSLADHASPPDALVPPASEAAASADSPPGRRSNLHDQAAA